jgi:hypothetical protein
MIRMASHTIALLLFGVLLHGCVEQQPETFRRAGRLDASRAFYYPGFGTRPETVLATLREGDVDAATYMRYLAGRLGTRYLEDLAFDMVLERECRARGLVKNAPLLARSAAARRFHESGRRAKSDPDGSQQRKFINEALRKMRVDALVAANKRRNKGALRALFDRRFGVGGERVRVRHVLISYRATGRRLHTAGEIAEAAAVEHAARIHATELRERLRRGDKFDALLGSSDDRTTKTMLRDPKQAPEAGSLPSYNYVRYGESFARAVRVLKVGEVSLPVASSVGYHLVQLLDRKITKLEDVEEQLRQELGRGSAKPAEVSALRRALFEKHGFAPRLPGK